MRYGVLLAVCVLAVSGCAKLSHLRELLTLKGYSDGQDQLGRYVAERDAQFADLEQAVATQDLRGMTQAQLVARFGPPVFQGQPAVSAGREGQEEWLYRRQAPFAASAKVYLYFDADEKVVDVVVEPAPEAATENAAG